MPTTQEQVKTLLAEQDAAWERITQQVSELGDLPIQVPETMLHEIEEACTAHVLAPINFGGLRA